VLGIILILGFTIGSIIYVIVNKEFIFTTTMLIIPLVGVFMGGMCVYLAYEEKLKN
jgi:hypothetical protein